MQQKKHFSIKNSYCKDIDNELKELNEIRKGKAHKKTKTTTNIIDKSENIRLGNLRDIQIAKVTQIERKHNQVLDPSGRHFILEK